MNDGEIILVSAWPLGGDWGTLSMTPFPLDSKYALYHTASYYRYGDLEVGGTALRIWQASDDPEHIAVCAHRCTDPWTPLGPAPAGRDRAAARRRHTPDGRYRYGDLTVATIPGNPDLLADRVQLLRLRDTLAGTGTLDWDHDTP